MTLVNDGADESEANLMPLGYSKLDTDRREDTFNFETCFVAHVLPRIRARPDESEANLMPLGYSKLDTDRREDTFNFEASFLAET
ncbi:hypothetical protein RSAG8_09386, partial [Rhizoctonia solani AG-8 WAC10335]